MIILAWKVNMNANDIIIGGLVLVGLLQMFFNWSYDKKIQALQSEIKELKDKLEKELNNVEATWEYRLRFVC